ncbi:little elongation complex subunit 1 [Peromyscus eremicus]|uniref:little elongation complex subunit 1 n=1 Tax=Peromyscus eremicus TaxID=42410 RepID=UPI0027DC7F08|nr:little elongation complex subunit 1 [Peromyscus eremicus]
MMPGETHPAAPGPADLARCQGCASLQQNLNEYVEALIALKQKIINTDNLLTEYQKKCDELQFARRENSMLHHQVEQMLQKISPLQKCQEELDTLRAELEEKKSSLKLYQNTHQEYARVKEECLKSDAQKKKLEAKVKKLEEAAVKHTQDFKQLRNEKKILEKEFKKTQERFDEFSKQKNEKELRHIGTQISSDSPGSIDKRKVKVLLKELWLCVNTAHRLAGESGRRIPENPAKENSVSRTPGEDELLPVQGSPARTSDMRSFFTKLSMEMEGDLTSSESTEEELPRGRSPSTEHALHEESHPEVSGQRPGDGNSDLGRTNICDHGHFFDDDLQAAIDFFKLPPPLLSPVPSPPPMTSPHLSSSLAPESYFGEFTDSSDSDSAPLRTSVESALEEYTADTQRYLALLEKLRRSDTYMGQPRSQEVAPALNKLAPIGFDTRRVALGEPSATSSLARGRHWIASPEFVRDRRDRRDIVEEAEGKVEAQEMDKPVRIGKGLLKHNRRLWVERASRGSARKKVARAGESEVCSSPFGKRTFSELRGSEGKTLSSKAFCSPQSEFTKWTLTSEFASKSHHMLGSGRFQRKEKDAQESTLESGVRAAAAGRDHSASLPSSSTSVPVSLCSNRKAGTPDLHRSEQKSPTRTSNTFLLWSEPPARFPKENDPENSLSALSPKSKLGASTFSDLKNRGPEPLNIFKSTGKAHSIPQSVFQKPTRGGQCGGRGRITLPKSDWTSLAHSQAGFTRRSPSSADSSSWHRSDVLRRGGKGNPGATSEHQQKTRLQPEKAASASQNSRWTAVLGPPGESTIPLEFKAAASLLPNQVSVITKQARPEKMQSSNLEHWQPRGSALSPSTDSDEETNPSLSEYDGDEDPIAQSTEERADEERPSPEVSLSDSMPAENSGSSTDKLLFSSEDSLIQSQYVMKELLQKLRKSPHTTESGASSLEAGKLLPAEVTSRDCSAGEMPCGAHHQANTEAPVVARDSHSIPQNASTPPTVPSRPLLRTQVPTSPVCPSGLGSADEETQSTSQSRPLLRTRVPTSPVCPSGLGSADEETQSTSQSRPLLRTRVPTSPVCPSGLGSADEETRSTSQSSLPGASCSYTGVREQREDTEGEDEAFSYSEGEQEAEAVTGRQPQDAAGDSQRHLGDPEARVDVAGRASDVGDLTSALQECNLSTFLYIDKLSTSEVVMFLESCQLRDYSSRASVSECSSRGTLNNEMNKEFKQGEVFRENHGKRFSEEMLPASSEERVESEGGNCRVRNSSQHAQGPLEMPSDNLPKATEELHASRGDCSGTDAEQVLLLSTHHSQAAEDRIEHTRSEETSSSVSHTAELPEPAAVGAGGSPPLSGRSDPEHIPSRSEDETNYAGCPSTGEEGLAEPGELLALSSDSLPPPRTEQSSDCVTETAFRYQISAVTSEVISVLINKDQDLVIEKGDNWTIISGVAISPGMEQVVLCDTLEAFAPQDLGGLDSDYVEKSPEASPDGPLPQGSPCGGGFSAAREDVSSSGQSANFDKSRLRNRPVKPSIWIRSQIYDQTLETEKVASDHTYYNWKLEPLGKNRTRSKISSKDQSSKLAKTPGLTRGEVHLNEVPQPVLGERTNTKMPGSQVQSTMAGADMSTPANSSPDTLSKIRQEVGPPLPPLLPPLIATPPRTSRPLSPLIPSSSPSSLASPAGRVSPLREIAGAPVLSPWPEELQQPSPLDASPSPSAAAAASGRVVSSPLQFCAATPKHALPVPGRLPSCAPGHAAVSGPQENSVKILDTMYPELSARARTLSLLKGNMQLSRGCSVDGKVLPGRVSALLGLKAITSTSTAFVLTGGSSGGDSSQGKSQDLNARQDAGRKRTLAASMLRSAKRLRLESESPEPGTSQVTAGGVPEDPPGGTAPAELVPAEEEHTAALVCSPASQLHVNPREMAESYNTAISRALRKIAESSFDLLPVIRSHVYVGNISRKPVMRDQEKEVVYEFSTTNKHLGEYLLRSILSELKVQKTSLDHSYIHALCRVYVGICRQLGDLERARLFCYSLLKEDFPESEKLTLFIANMWREVFLSQSAVSEAMQLVARQRARGEVLNCLRVFLSWEKNAPIDVGIVVSKLLLTIQLCPKTEFQSSEEFGEDLSANIWEYIFAIDLLCCHQRWIWTHDNIISKELWPVMDKWIKYRKGHSNIAYTPDVIVASVLRLIGRLGQLGLKEGFPTAVKNISSVIGMFIQHAQDEDIPWGVQLAAVYALCDLSPSNPAEISRILEAWRTQTSNTIPSAIVSCLEEVGSLSVERSAGSTSTGDSAP